MFQHVLVVPMLTGRKLDCVTAAAAAVVLLLLPFAAVLLSETIQHTVGMIASPVRNMPMASA